MAASWRHPASCLCAEGSETRPEAEGPTVRGFAKLTKVPLSVPASDFQKWRLRLEGVPRPRGLNQVSQRSLFLEGLMLVPQDLGSQSLTT